MEVRDVQEVASMSVAKPCLKDPVEGPRPLSPQFVGLRYSSLAVKSSSRLGWFVEFAVLSLNLTSDCIRNFSSGGSGTDSSVN